MLAEKLSNKEELDEKLLPNQILTDDYKVFTSLHKTAVRNSRHLYSTGRSLFSIQQTLIASRLLTGCNNNKLIRHSL
jgi:hypothetical protein